MKTDITQALVNEHRLILRMIALLERNATGTARGIYTNWQFYQDGVDFIRSYADRFHHAKEEDALFTTMAAHAAANRMGSTGNPGALNTGRCRGSRLRRSVPIASAPKKIHSV